MSSNEFAQAGGDRVREQITAWARELIDLTRRNRSLYYRPTKRTTLEIASPAADAIFRALTSEASFTFLVPPPPTDGRPWTVDDSIAVAGPNELVSTRTEEQDLERTLKALARAAEQDLMDRGVQTLYAALGMLEWRESSGEDGRVRSPLLYVPVSLARSSPRDPFIVQAAPEDVLLNPSLVVKLESDFGIDLSSAADAAGDATELDHVLRIVASLVRERGWSVSATTILTRSTFHKESMYRDLLDNIDVIAEHPLVQSLAGEPPDLDDAEVGDLPDEQDVDEFAPPEQALTILDADASQRRAILAAQRGASFVMDGPPGTGKSQTIANMIAELIAAGKKVLFVSEKAAALDVVASRLRSRGIDEFVLELHSHKASRKEVVQQLDRSLRHHMTAKPRLSRTDLSRAELRRSELTSYAAAVNEVREPLGRTVSWVAGRLAQLASAPALPAPATIGRDLDDEGFDALLHTAERLSRVWQPVADEEFVWHGFAGEALRLGEREQLVASLDAASDASQQLREAADELAYGLGVGSVDNHEAVERLIRITDHLKAQPYTPIEWWTQPQLDRVAGRLQQLTAFLRALDRLGDTLNVWYPDAVPQLVPLSAAEAGRLGSDLSEAAPFYRTENELPLAVLRDAHTRLEHLAELLVGVQRDADYVFSALGAEAEGRTLEEIRRVARVASRAGESVRPEASWLDPAIAERVREAAQLLHPLQEEFHAQLRVLSDTFTEEVLELDLTTIRVRVEQANGIRKLARPYREAKAALRPVTRSGRVDRSVREAVSDAAQAKEMRDHLDGREAAYEDVLGRYFRKHATDTAAVDQALSLLNSVVHDLQGIGQPAAVAEQFTGSGPADRDLAVVGARLLADVEVVLAAGNQMGVLAPGDPEPMAVADLAAWVLRMRPLVSGYASLLEVVEPVRSAPASLADLVEDLRHIEQARSIRATLATAESADRELFHGLYEGERTDTEAVADALAWVQTYRDLLGGPATDRQSRECHGSNGPALLDGPVREAITSASKTRNEVLDRFVSERREQLVVSMDSSFDWEQEFLGELMDRVDDVDIWCEHRRLIGELELAGLHDTVTAAVSGRLAADQVLLGVERAVLAAWMDDVLDSDDRLHVVRASERDALVQEFSDLDQRILRDASEHVIAACNGSRPRTNFGGAATIQREAQKKRRHMPVRRLLQDTVDVATALKPCFMMSPLSVSQFLPTDWRFDVVIFDEASQITPADAINCVYRGHQLVIAGDDRQLPPTSFFQSSMDDDDGYEEDQFDQFESVLGLCKGSEILHSLPLRWHYRSRHEDLITFSNYRFYDGQLITYPGAESERPDLGVDLHVIDGVYRRGGRRDNPSEAEYLAERVMFHAREHPDLTVGVVALSSAQADTVEDIIERRRADHPELDEYFAADRLDGFFVKNLENVQGDERDIILLSIGYGPDEAGKFTMNFGPINREGGERRLNVAITRARRRVEVVASFSPEQMRPGDSKSRGLHELQRYLEYLRTGHAALAVDTTGSMGDVESPFEAEVQRTISGWGFEVVPQVGSAGYRVDLGVRDPGNPGRYMIGIECDGAAYHSSRVARDRDRLRQEVLEGLGWTLHRVWGSSWYRYRATAEAELREALEAAASGSDRPSRRRVARQALQREVEVVDLSARPHWAVPYEVALIKPTTRDRADSPRGLGELHELVETIVRVESPVHREVVGRRIATAFGHNLTRRTQAAVDAALSSLAHRGTLRRDGDICWMGTDLQVRVPRDGDQATRRDVGHIPAVEREAAVFHLLRDAHVSGRDELLDAVKGLFGWARMGPQIASALADALDHLKATGKVSESDDGRLRALEG